MFIVDQLISPNPNIYKIAGFVQSHVIEPGGKKIEKRQSPKSSNANIAGRLIRQIYKSLKVGFVQSYVQGRGGKRIEENQKQKRNDIILFAIIVSELIGLLILTAINIVRGNVHLMRMLMLINQKNQRQ